MWKRAKVSKYISPSIGKLTELAAHVMIINCNATGALFLHAYVAADDSLSCRQFNKVG